MKRKPFFLQSYPYTPFIFRCFAPFLLFFPLLPRTATKPPADFFLLLRPLQRATHRHAFAFAFAFAFCPTPSPPLPRPFDFSLHLHAATPTCILPLRFHLQVCRNRSIFLLVLHFNEPSSK